MAALPVLVAHADWGAPAERRRLAYALRQPDGRFTAYAPGAVGDPQTLLARLRTLAPNGGILFGVDFPIGLPLRYATIAGITDLRRFCQSWVQGDGHPSMMLPVNRAKSASFARSTRSDQAERGRRT
jgi:hypothetical protein